LDPAGPYFEDTDPSVRLDPTDAMFVDVIHTDGTHNLLLGLGMEFNFKCLFWINILYTILSFFRYSSTNGSC